jgi:hypothetical protein
MTPTQTLLENIVRDRQRRIRLPTPMEQIGLISLDKTRGVVVDTAKCSCACRICRFVIFENEACSTGDISGGTVKLSSNAG